MNPALLDAMADDFVKSGFDVRRLVRTIMTSWTYQLSAEPNETNREDEVNFSRAIVKRLPAEELLDALTAVIGGTHKLYDSPDGTRAGKPPASADSNAAKAGSASAGSGATQEATRRSS